MAVSRIFSDIEIPDGVDPAFLAALPEDMRAEVIRDHRRQQRAQRAAQPPSVPPQVHFYSSVELVQLSDLVELVLFIGGKW